MGKKKSTSADEEMTTASILEYFAAVAESRIERSRLHPLASVLVLSLCAVVCGADSFVAIEHFGRAREAWLKTFLDLPNGIPSHDTIGRIFALLDPKALEEAFRRWTAEIATLTKGEVVAIDGKTLRRSFQTADRTAFVHMVSAWAAGNRMVLGQVKTDDKSNEITAIPRLLELLRIEGCLVTIDAMGCQKEIANKIVDRGADYMLSVKDNQPTLSASISGIFDEALRDPNFPNSANHSTTTEKAHGRTEVRRCWTKDIDPECGASFDEWTNVKCIVLVERERTIGDKTSIERCHYIASRPRISAKAALAATRAHWGTENQLHWVLDVAFREDDCRVRAGHAAENFAVIRHIAVNLLKAVPGGMDGKKLGVKNKRLLAGWHDGYLLRVLGVMSRRRHLVRLPCSGSLRDLALLPAVRSEGMVRILSRPENLYWRGSIDVNAERSSASFHSYCSLLGTFSSADRKMLRPFGQRLGPKATVVDPLSPTPERLYNSGRRTKARAAFLERLGLDSTGIGGYCPYPLSTLSVRAPVDVRTELELAEAKSPVKGTAFLSTDAARRSFEKADAELKALVPAHPENAEALRTALAFLAGISKEPVALPHTVLCPPTQNRQP